MRTLIPSYAVFFQTYAPPQVPLDKPNNASARLNGHAGLHPTWQDR